MPRGDTANLVPRKPQRRPAHQSYAREMEQEMTPDDLHAIGQESPTAFKLMPVICKMLATPYPPKQGDTTPIVGVTELTLFINSLETA